MSLSPKCLLVQLVASDRVLGRVGNEPYFNLKFLSDEEVLALHTKLQEIRGELFTKDIMARLLADDSSREASTDSVGGRSKNPYHHQLDAQKLQLEAIKLQIEKQKAEARYNNSIARVFNKWK